MSTDTRQLLRAIPRNAATVVHLGCDDDALAAACRRFDPGCRHVAIEAARAADLSGAALRAAAGGPIDCLVYTGVLERCADPGVTLRDHAAQLSEEGVVVACLPNVQHWPVLRGLLEGKWIDDDPAPGAPRHLFTVDGMAALLRRAGLTVYDAQPLDADNDGAAPFLRAIAPALEALALDRARFAHHVAVPRFAVRAARHARPRLLVNMLTLRQPIGTDVRMAEPAQFLATLPDLRIVNSVERVTAIPGLPGEARVLVMQRRRMQRPRDFAALRDLLRDGYLLVSEFDDHPAFYPEIAEHDHLSFRGVHAVQVSTPALADLVRPWNPNLAVFANAIAELPPPRRRRSDGPATLFFGAFNRGGDWPPILAALDRVLSAAGERARIEVVNDRPFFDALATPRKRFTPMCDYATYRQILASADIALLPLADTPFNRMKSDLKFVEAAAHSVVALASPTVYAESIVDGETGALFRTPEEFGMRLARLIDDAEERDCIAGNAYRHVGESRLLCRHFAARRDWYRRLVAERERLDAELHARVPELR